MSNWEAAFAAVNPPVAPASVDDFDTGAAQLDDFTAADFLPPEPEAPTHEETRLAPPFDLSGIDLLSPPGFVGDITAWIDSQCRYPRRRLAVASAIVSVGNVGGLSHEDTRDGVTANMLAFCVAASSTGKEAVMQAMTDIHRSVGLHRAMVGMIKSEKEILDNLIEHQPAYFVVDEFGIFLQKVRNAQKRGGAGHLEGVMGILMSAFSKANSRFLLGGKEKRELRKQYATALYRAEENEKKEDVEFARRMLNMIDDGLERPFLSLVGYTTPSTFDSVMDGEAATQGFIGRALLVSEKDINPEMRENFKRRDLPQGMAMRLSQLWHGGSYSLDDDTKGRIEGPIPRTRVETTPEADEMLNTVVKWLHRYADDMNELTGEASVAMIRRAYEMIAKISFILAMATRQRTAEHVRWAFAYVRQELDNKISLVFANDNEKGPQAGAAIQARVFSILDEEKGMTSSVIANRLKMKVDDVEKVLEALAARGAVVKEESKRKYRGKLVSLWKVKVQG